MVSLFKTSIKKQLYLLILMLALPTAAIILHTAVEKREEDIQKARNEVRSFTETISLEQKNLVAGAQQLLSTLVQLPEVQTHDVPRLQQLLSHALRLNPQYMNISITDRNGNLWVSAVPSSVPVSVADRRYFINARNTCRFSSGEYVVGKLLRKPMMGFCSPILDPDGEFAGSIVVHFDPERFRALLQRSGLPEGFNYLITDHKGVIVSRGIDPAQVMGKPIEPELLREMKQGGEDGLTVGTGVDGVKRLSYFEKLTLDGEDSPYMYIVAGVPVAAVTADANRVLIGHLALFTPWVILAFLFVWLLAKRSIVDPISSLEYVSQRMAEGDLGVKLPGHVVEGELGRLGRSLEEMARRLSQRERERDAAETALRRSEAYYRSIFDNALFGIAQTDLDMRFTHVNGAFCALLGYEKGELVGVKTAADVTHPDDVGKSVELFSRVHRREIDHYTLEKRYITKSGEVRNCMCFIEEIQDEEGNYVGHSGCVLNITELRASEERMRLFFERQVVGMGIASPEKRWLKTNEKLQRMFGYSADQLSRMTWEDLTHPDDLEPSQTKFDKVLAGELNDYTLQKKFVRKDGSVMYADLSVGCVRRDDGKVDYFLAVISDITKRKLAEKELRTLQKSLERRVRERTAQLEEAIGELEAFSYSVSHDLRSPLRHINSYISIFFEEYGDALTPDGRFFLDRACTASVKMGKLIDDLLELSRVGRAEMIKETVDLSRLACDITAMLRETEPQREVEVEIAEGLTAQGDKNLLELVMMNLLGNAWKFTSRSEAARVVFGRKEVQGQEVFFVGDNGAGFDMEYQDKLFGPFQRLHGDEYQGTGIGLATVKRAIDRHGGAVWGQSELGGGATFYFKVP